ncbi:hypothetical protein GCM10025858_00130 [Alicyclobacillus sacchari]|nr:hypothetical protein GCM10025858_00130 [Alicyclobacillus sacchari]
MRVWRGAQFHQRQPSAVEIDTSVVTPDPPTTWEIVTCQHHLALGVAEHHFDVRTQQNVCRTASARLIFALDKARHGIAVQLEYTAF